MTAMVKSQYSNAIKVYGKTCVQLIFEQASKHPDAVALINGATDQKWTYYQLVVSVKRVAVALRWYGLQKADVVCVCTTNYLETAITMLAIIHAGGILTGMNPTFTPGEMLQQFRDSRTRYMVTTPDVLERVKSAQKEHPLLQKIFTIGHQPGYTSFEDLLSTQISQDADVRVEEEDLAMLPYSSGTTGAPKGVMLTHRNLSAITQILSHPEVQIFDRLKRTMSVFPLYHVGGFVINMLHALHSLSCVVYLPRYTFTTYLQAMEKYKIQVSSMPPTLLLLFANSAEVANYDLSHLYSVCVGAAPISPHVAEQVKKRLSVEVRQVYGMTETTCLCHVTPRHTTDLSMTGVPLPNIECKIIDPVDGQTVAFHEKGEVCIRGPNIMRGYLRRPEATANTLSSDDWLRTGDIGYMKEDGSLYIIDRLKDVIKYKGYQVAPAELESLLLSHPDVADVAVVGVHDEEAGELPRAYIVPKPNRVINCEEVQEFIKARVAPYKRLRGGVKVVPSIPKTGSGKILRRHIRATIVKEEHPVSKL